MPRVWTRAVNDGSRRAASAQPVRREGAHRGARIAGARLASGAPSDSMPAACIGTDMNNGQRIRIEEPASGRIDAIVSTARGWIAGDAAPGAVTLGVGELAFPVGRVRRRDVERAHPGKSSCGFNATIDFRLRIPERDDRLVLRTGGEEVLVGTLDVEAIRQAHRDWHAAKQRKLAWLGSRLACPGCDAALDVPVEAGEFACQSCGRPFRRTTSAIDLISPDLRAQYRLA